MSSADDLSFEHGDINALRNLGVDVERLNDYDFLLLPENLREAGSREELYDAGSSINLAKSLRAEGAKVATSYDLTPEARTLERRGAELWFGTVWVMSAVALPLAISVLANMITGWQASRIASKDGKGIMRTNVKIRLKRGDNIVNIDFDGDPEALVDVLEGLKSGKSSKNGRD